MRWTMLAVVLGFALDLLLGDPRWMYHPVRMIGNLISFLEKIIRSCLPESKAGQRAGGALLVLMVVIISTAIPGVLLWTAYRYAWWLGLILETIFCYQLLATKALRDESMKVYVELEKEDLPAARKAVSMIVGRDTDQLTEEGITKAAVETVAENTSDGVVAPLFYMMIGGATLGFAYKAINTMDSMVGYKNEKYQFFGTCAAKLDDIVNFVPARVAGGIMILASYLCKLNGKEAKRIYLRDRKNHASPNSAQTEAVMAGALQVQLAGDAWYFGKQYKKPTIGDPKRPIQIQDIPRSCQLLYGTAALSAFLFVALRGVIQLLFFI